MEEIRVKVWNDLDHPFFDHVEDKKEIEKEFLNGKTHIVFFEFSGKERMAAIISETNKGIHVREMGGKYIWGMRYVETYCQLLAEQLGKKFITFRTKIEAVKVIGARLGFFPFYTHDDFSVEYEKEIKNGRQ